MESKITFEVNLPASKSESNRALIIQALAVWQSGAKIALHNLSEANDTILLKKIVSQPLSGEPIDAQDAGTAFRFLTAYLAVTGQKCTLTGTPRMQERPIGILVDALRTLGADIAYTGKENLPPLTINGFQQTANSLEIQADVSSQYISALLLIAPVLPNGLTIRLVGKVASKPYIEMTLQQMAHFGIQINSDWDTQVFNIAPQQYQAGSYTIESDWSAASYWYSAMAMLTHKMGPSVTALRKGRMEGELKILLKGLRKDTFQGDSYLVELMEYWGVKSVFEEKGVFLNHFSPKLPQNYTIDFMDCPDIAQTVIAFIGHYAPPLGPWQVRYPSPPNPWSVAYPAPTKARLIRTWTFTGLESLRIKETDRIFALQTELIKLGIVLYEKEAGVWTLKKQEGFALQQPISIDTYHDHRMAMSFAPIGLVYQLNIQNPAVVKKSYPHFWEEWERFCKFIQLYETK